MHIYLLPHYRQTVLLATRQKKMIMRTQLGAPPPTTLPPFLPTCSQKRQKHEKRLATCQRVSKATWTKEERKVVS